MSQIPINPQDLPDQIARLKAIKHSREEAVRIPVQSSHGTAISTNVPLAADSDIRIGDENVIFKEKPEAKWTGPLVVANVNGKILTLDSRDRILLSSVENFKLYQNYSQDIDPSHNKFNKSNDNHDYLRKLDDISNQRELHQRILARSP